jgi:hypothetical protein
MYLEWQALRFLDREREAQKNEREKSEIAECQRKKVRFCGVSSLCRTTLEARFQSILLLGKETSKGLGKKISFSFIVPYLVHIDFSTLQY